MSIEFNCILLFVTTDVLIVGYHWDCSDWVPSPHTLPNITEVPGSEVLDSSSIHSNTSNESIIRLSASGETNSVMTMYLYSFQSTLCTYKNYVYVLNKLDKTVILLKLCILIFLVLIT